MIRKDKRKVIENILYEYLDSRSTSESLELLEKKTEEASTQSFVKKFPEELKILSEFIFIGLGREKSLRAEGSLKNKDYLVIRESMSMKEDELRRKNEAELTQIKIQSNKRKKRKEELESKGLSWDIILGEYKTGSTMSELSAKYNISMHLMREQLKDDGELDLSRSTLEKRKIANSELSKLEDKFIIELLNKNKLDSKDVLWKKAKVTYPWLLRRQFYDKIEELGLSRSEEEIKEIKRIKSRTGRNSSNSTILSEVVNLLEESKINYKKKPRSEMLEIGNTSINLPKITSFSDKKKALNMQMEFELKGRELVTVLPWVSPEMIFNFISYKAKVSTPKQIPARKCSLNITEGINKFQKEFIRKNHLLGYTRNLKNITHTVTLEHNGEQVMMAVFSKTNKENIIELKRLVSLSGISVQGGASKILKNYIKENPSIGKITTFSDCDLGWGSVYGKLGFKQIQRSKEQLTWYNPILKRKFSNVSLMMIGADRLLKNLENYEAVGVGDNLPSNAEIVQKYGFVPVYDSGYKKWELEVNK